MLASADGGTRTGFDGPVVPEVNMMKKGRSAPCRTGSNSGECAERSASRPAMPASTTTIVASIPSSFARLAASVKMTCAPLAPMRCSIAFGPKAVNSG